MRPTWHTVPEVIESFLDFLSESIHRPILMHFDKVTFSEVTELHVVCKSTKLLLFLLGHLVELIDLLRELLDRPD